MGSLAQGHIDSRRQDWNLNTKSLSSQPGETHVEDTPLTGSAGPTLPCLVAHTPPGQQSHHLDCDKVSSNDLSNSSGQTLWGLG